jgi:YhcH/YjgK/YiaL family protein
MDRLGWFSLVNGLQRAGATMILDTLDRLAVYASLHPGFVAAIPKLVEMLAAPPESGRFEIDGTRLFIVVVRDAGRGRDASPLEFHRQYIDIQVSLEADDVIGWRPLSACGQPSQPYDVDRDIGFVADRPETWLHVPRGCFAIFYPEDAHAPMATTGQVVKAVAKVAVAWDAS